MTDVEGSEESKSRSRRRTRSIKNSLRKTKRVEESHVSRFDFVDKEIREVVTENLVGKKSGKKRNRGKSTSKKMRGDVSVFSGKSQRKRKRGRNRRKSRKKTPKMSKFEKSSRRRKMRIAAIEKQLSGNRLVKPKLKLVRHNFKTKELDMSIFETENRQDRGKENVEKNLLEIFYNTENVSDENEVPPNWVNVQYCSKMSKESLQKLRNSKTGDSSKPLISDNFDTFNAKGNNYIEQSGVLQAIDMNAKRVEARGAEKPADESTQVNTFDNNPQIYRISDSSSQFDPELQKKCEEEIEKSLSMLKSMTKNFQDENQIMSFLRQTFSDRFDNVSLSDYEQQIQAIVDNRRKELNSNLRNFSENVDLEGLPKGSRRGSKRKSSTRKYSSHKFPGRRGKENSIRSRKSRRASSGSRGARLRSLSNNSKHSSGTVVGKIQRFQC